MSSQTFKTLSANHLRYTLKISCTCSDFCCNFGVVLDYFSPLSRHECGTTTGGCVGTKTSTLSACGCLSLSLFIFLFVAHEQKYASDSSITATANTSRAICRLFCISPRFVYDYRRMRWLVIRWLIYHRTRCSSSSVAGIPLHEIFVIILPTISISKFVNTVVDSLA